MIRLKNSTNKPVTHNSAGSTWVGIGMAFVLAAFSHGLQAKDYAVEILLFENNTDASVTEKHDYVAPIKPTTGGKTWLLETGLLSEQAELLEQSPDYTLWYHSAWGQESQPYRNAATYTLLEQDAQGYIKVYAEQLLFANIDIDFKGFRMIEKRRLKLNEKHFFDHPKFGILMQVSRLQKPQAESNAADE